MDRRQTKPYRSPPAKSSLKIVAGTDVGKSNRLRAGGLEPSESMEPGKFLVSCTGGTITKKGRTTIAVLEFSIVDGPHSGTALRQWITIPDVDGVVPIASRYAKQCVIALGREIDSGDDLDPAAIFRAKLFSVQVGYRMTEKIGGTASEENALRRKDAKDFLRVHKIFALEELP